MKSLLKIAKKEALAYFNAPINPKKHSDLGRETYIKNGSVHYAVKTKLGASRPKKGKMHGEI